MRERERESYRERGKKKEKQPSEKWQATVSGATENAPPRGAKYANDALKRDISALRAVVEIRWYHLGFYCFHDACGGVTRDQTAHLGLAGRR